MEAKFHGESPWDWRTKACSNFPGHTTVFRRTWTDAEELLKEKSFFILSFVFLSELVIRQVQTNIDKLLVVEILCNLLLFSGKRCLHFSRH